MNLLNLQVFNSGVIDSVIGLTNLEIVRLKSLGFTKGNKVTVTNKNKRALIVEVNGRRVAISNDVAKNVNLL